MPAPSASAETRRPLLRPKVKCSIERVNPATAEFIQEYSDWWDREVCDRTDVIQLEQLPADLGELVGAGPAQDRRGQRNELVFELPIGHRVVGRAEIVRDMALERAPVTQRQHHPRRILGLYRVDMDANLPAQPRQLRVGDTVVGELVEERGAVGESDGEHVVDAELPLEPGVRLGES